MIRTLLLVWSAWTMAAAAPLVSADATTQCIDPICAQVGGVPDCSAWYSDDPQFTGVFLASGGASVGQTESCRGTTTGADAGPAGIATASLRWANGETTSDTAYAFTHSVTLGVGTSATTVSVVWIWRDASYGWTGCEIVVSAGGASEFAPCPAGIGPPSWPAL